jgi:hypothetical protein
MALLVIGDIDSGTQESRVDSPHSGAVTCDIAGAGVVSAGQAPGLIRLRPFSLTECDCSNSLLDLSPRLA